MATFLNKLHRARRLSAAILLQKIATRVSQSSSRRARRMLDLFVETFSSNRPSGTLRTFLKPPVNPRDSCLMLEVAEKYQQHFFDLLGSGWVKVAHGERYAGFESHRYGPGEAVEADAEGRWLNLRVGGANRKECRRIWSLVTKEYVPIDWHVDFKSGHRWPERQYFSDIKFGQPEGADVKVPWELARMQHLVYFAYVHSLPEYPVALRERCQREFCDQILDFIATNPPRFGVNWSCTMEVAIRISNILLAQDMFRASGAQFSAEFDALLMRTTLEHGHHIRNHLEWNAELRGNHYLSNLVGLVFAASYMPRSSQTLEWMSFASQELIKETDLQFGSDGANFEASTCYHALSAEMLIFATALLLREGIALPEKFVNKLHQIAGFLSAVSDNRKIMQVGDNDSGRFVKFCSEWDRAATGELSEDPLDVDAIIAAYAGLLGRQKLSFAPQSSAARDVVEQLASVLPTLAENTIQAGATENAFTKYEDFGLYIYTRHWGRLTVRCGPIGQNGNGGHAHNDQLSIQLHSSSGPIFIDPGTFVYTASPQGRNLFRSTAMHNTLSVSGREQNDWYEGIDGLFFMKADRTRSETLSATASRFIGQHWGFGSAHRRTIELFEKMIIVSDEFEDPANATIHLHLHPEAEAALDGETAIVTRGNTKLRVFSDQAPWIIFNSEYSSGYGEKSTTRQLKFRPVAVKSVWRLAFL